MSQFAYIKYISPSAPSSPSPSVQDLIMGLLGPGSDGSGGDINLPNTCCVGFYHLLHIGPGVFEVTSASEGLLLEVVEMEKERKGRGKKGDCRAGVDRK